MKLHCWPVLAKSALLKLRRLCALLPLSLSLSFSLSACQQLSTPAEPAQLSQTAIVLPAETTTPQLYLLGEVHDNGAGHQARLRWLQALVQQHQQHQKPLLLALEQFDFEQQAQLQAAQAACRDATCLLQFMQTASSEKNAPRSLWHWPHYAAVLQLALDHKLPLLAANLSRSAARKVVQGGYAAALTSAQRQAWQLDDAAEKNPHQALQQAQQDQVLAAHCQQLPANLAPGMAKAQIARDLLMAEQLLQAAGSVVLLAGNGHIRKDLGVPYWLNFARQHNLPGSSDKTWHSVAFLEQAPSQRNYADQWQLIAPLQRSDPCASLTSTTTPTKGKS